MKESGKKMHEKELIFFKEELEKTNTKIKHHSYGGKLEKITKLWESRKDIVNELPVEFNKDEISFLEGEVERINAQIKAYTDGVNKESRDKVIELIKLRKSITEEIKKREEAKPLEIKWV